MNTLGSKAWHTLKPDAQAFDEIRIRIVPRYKESYLSGDEWRISTQTEFWRKGELVHSVGHGNMLTAAGMLYADFTLATDAGLGYYAGERDICDQEGCQQKAEVFYALKAEYCREGHKTPCTPNNTRYRQFCKRHAVRGDCGLEDSDDNYIVIGDPNVVSQKPADAGGISGLGGGDSGESGQSPSGRSGPDYDPTSGGHNSGAG